MMESVKNAVKQATTAATSSKKVAQLQTDTIDNGTKPFPQTTEAGVKIADPENWLRVSNGSTPGPDLLEDHIAREKIHNFDHERIPERVVHARGAGAHGTFKVYDDRASKYTLAPVLTDASRSTSVFMRFSTVQGSRGSADSVRDVRGFAVKFYTDEGNWDVVGNDIPVFFIQDAIQFPDLIHAVKPEPQNEVPQGQSAHNNFWDFVGLKPEASHMVMWAMSDRGIPRSYSMIQGFGVNTYTLYNAAGERFFVKFHFTPELGVHSLVWDEALKIAGQDPDFHRKGLEEAITNGAYPKWFFGIQVIPEAKEHDFDFDILDATKLWPEELVPVEVLGELELNRMPDEYFPEVEQVAFATSHVVPGIGFSDDPLLQGRNFSYQDTQITRLGKNWEELPINRPVCPVMNTNRDGAMRHRIHKGTVNYHPNRFDQFHPTPKEQGGYAEFAQRVEGIKQRVRTPKFQEHYNQAQLFYNSMSPHEQAHIIAAISFELSHCDDPVVYESYTKLLANIDLNLAQTVAHNVGGVVPEKLLRENKGQRSAFLSQTAFQAKTPTIKTRRIAILVDDGFSLAEVEAFRALIKSAMAVSYVIGPRRGKIASSDGAGHVWADHHFEGQRSTLFDAFIIPSGPHVAKLAANGRVVHWVREAFGHLKVIGALGEAIAFLQTAVQLPGVQFAASLDSAAVTTSYGVVTAGKYDLKSASTDALSIAPGETGFISNFAFEVSKHRCFERETDGLASKVAF